MSEPTPPDESTGGEPGGPGSNGEALPWYREPWARFAVGFSVAVSLFEVAYYGLVLESEAFELFMRALAQATGAVLEPFYDRVSVVHARVSTNRFVVNVDDGCDGLQVGTLLTSAVLAFPSTWRQKLIGVVAGNLWLQAWNVVRIATLVAVGGIQRTWFHPTHVYIWPTLLIALCLATWLAWARWTIRNDEPLQRADAGA
jgi:exosortase H (IPTLxxWG-CTERM-specific)